MKNINDSTLRCLLFCSLAACGKKSTLPNNNNNGNHPDTVITVVTPPDPATALTEGFFKEGWTARSFTAPAFKEAIVPTSANDTVNVDAATIVTKISPALFGNNANLYMTQMVTEPALLGHITKLHPGIIRFPGGNLSSVYFWNAAPGNLPADAPANLPDMNGTMANAGYWFGRNNDSWTLSLDNYYRMLQQTSNEGIITLNYGYARYGTGPNPVAAAAHLAADWVRYDNGRTKYWEIGNESNGTWQAGYRIDQSQNKDGQPLLVTGDLYGRHAKIFIDSLRKAATEIGKPIYIGVQLLEQQPASWATPTDKSWNSGVLQQAGNIADYFIVHSYYTPYNTNSTPLEILASASTVTKGICDFVTSSCQAAGVSARPLALTEWNIFATGSQQMVSQVAGMHAVMVLEELMKNKFGMASRWDLSNAWDNGNDHGLFSTGDAASGESKWNPRPAFYYLYFLQKTLGDRCINTTATNTSILSYASTFSSGEISTVLVNKGNTPRNVQLTFKNFNAGNRFYWYTLNGGEGVTGFGRKVFVNGNGPDGSAGGPKDYENVKANAALTQNGIKVVLPPMSVAYVVIEKKQP
ncbi:alpha-L-arabinofuranosidase [Chitinophaga polysaccharea]|uniref:Alpha-L-arabinofuranosidase n=1 Tax=Chitinophaga polysaccharea TaxID=1293035 RepID=A0A561PGQ4_9BACT|nr:alpha-L-arabinofuranosidase [Chitinophaga polysaccharea]TWF37307.1 alpha-L-arabinofuranosidase [Chitinophaga polysaccharea]